MPRQCRICGVDLVPGENQYPSNAIYGVHRCNDCWKAWRRAHEPNNGPTRGNGRKRGVKRCEVHPECVRIYRSEVLRRANGICGVCRLPVGRHWHLDHIFPVVRGGIDCYDNLQPTHEECNLAKHDMTMEEYFAQQSGGRGNSPRGDAQVP